MTANAIAPGRPYLCEHCGGTFISDWTHEEAYAESKQLFGFVPELEEEAVICHACFLGFLAWARENGLTVEAA